MPDSSGVPAPAPTSDQNQAVMLKLSRRVIAALAKYKLYEKPVPVKCYEIGVSPCNRNRSVPNMKYVHQSLYKNVDSDGFDPERLLPSICVHYKDVLSYICGGCRKLHLGIAEGRRYCVTRNAPCEVCNFPGQL